MVFFSDDDIIAQRIVTSGIWFVAVIMAWLVGSAASTYWLTILRYQNQIQFGVSDPIFSQDVAFYIFSLPLLEFMQSWLIILLFLSLIGAGGIYLIEQRNNLEEGQIVFLPHAQLHLSVVGALIFMAFSWGHWLDMYRLMYSPRGAVFGASYTDIAVMLPVLRILMGVTVLVAISLLANIFLRKNIIPLALIFIWLISGFVMRGIAPGIVQRFIVEPNELEREKIYISHNIEFTNLAYGLDKIEEREFTNFQSLTAEDLNTNTGTIRNIRLWDYRPIKETFQQLQALRLYYRFHDVDLDRYDIDGDYRQVAISVREMDKTQLQSQTWVNQKLQFTHGYGVVVNPINEVTPDGLPRFWVKDLPPKSSVGLDVTQSEVYYGEQTTDYVIANTAEKEFSYPGTGDEAIYTHYLGRGGIKLDSFLKRVAFTLRLRDNNIILSRSITPESKLLLYRQIQQRVKKIAPFLKYDYDPYIVIGDDGKLYWIQDAYTTSPLYPYSEPIQYNHDDINYIRNSVKIIIDPYHGTVTFYLFDSEDPLAQTLKQIFPTMFKPASTMPEDLKRHLRYPEGMFTIQSSLYRLYHMRSANVFYNQEDLWAIPLETIYGNNQQPVEPYYLIARLPDEETEEFILIQPFTPHNKSNLTSWMAARSDGEHYGEIIVYQFSRQELIYGPQQIEARIDQDPEISPQLTLWGQGGSEVIRGHLLVLPMNDSLLYVEPLYLQAETGEIPELKRVIVANGDTVIMEKTLSKALNILVGEKISSDDGIAAGTDDKPGEIVIERTILEKIESANAHYQAAQEAMRDGDWATYGAELEALEKDLQELLNNTK